MIDIAYFFHVNDPHVAIVYNAGQIIFFLSLPLRKPVNKLKTLIGDLIAVRRKAYPSQWLSGLRGQLKSSRC